MINKGKSSLAINASMLDKKPTGLGIYSINIINSLIKLNRTNKAFDIEIFSSRGDFFIENTYIHKIPKVLESSTFNKFAAFARFVWNQIAYHFIAKEFTLSYCPTQHGSLFIKNQVITIHDLLSCRYPSINRFQSWYFRYIMPFIVKNSKAVITISEASKRDIIRYLNCPEWKIHVIHNGYEKEVFHPNYKEDIKIKYNLKEYILAVGPTLPHKNFTRLIKSYHVLPSDLKSKYNLAIIGGSKKYINRLKKLINSLNEEDNIRFFGYVPRQEIPLFYNFATVLIYPSLLEGFGLPPLEAMACGCPVITSQLSSMSEVCGSAAIYIDPYDTKEIAEALSEVLKNERLRKKYRTRGLKQASNFSWELSAQKIFEVLNILK